MSIIFEKLVKNRITPILQKNISPFQTGGAKGKGFVNNLFILRGLIDHAKFIHKEFWITCYDVGQCFDSL